MLTGNCISFCASLRCRHPFGHGIFFYIISTWIIVRISLTVDVVSCLSPVTYIEHGKKNPQFTTNSYYVENASLVNADMHAWKNYTHSIPRLKLNPLITTPLRLQTFLGFTTQYLAATLRHHAPKSSRKTAASGSATRVPAGMERTRPFRSLHVKATTCPPSRVTRCRGSAGQLDEHARAITCNQRTCK